MTSIEVSLAACVISCLGIVFFTYFAYPPCVWFLSRAFGRWATRPTVSDSALPKLAIIIAAHNEEDFIEERIENALAADYPPEKISVIIASDGSTDRTNEIVSNYADPRVQLIRYKRSGKTAILNELIPMVPDEVVVLSDANTFTEPEALRNLVAWFVNPEVGVVCGRLVLTDPQTGRNVDGIYWKYETFLKKCESRLGALLGSNGGLYAIRKSVFTPVPNNTLVEDFVMPLVARERTGCQIIYDSEAVAHEETPARMRSEFGRRARIGAGGFQCLGLLRGLLHPRHGWVAFTFFSHKVLRWSSPLLLLLALVSSFGFFVLTQARPEAVWSRYAAMVLLWGQLGFYLVALLGAWTPAQPKILRVFRLPTMFAMMNLALGVGFYRWLFGRQKVAWKRTERTVSPTVVLPKEIVVSDELPTAAEVKP